MEKTVRTEAVAAVDAAVTRYLARTTDGMPSGLAIPVRGGHGTGKTHLLLCEKARLRQSWRGGAEAAAVLSAPATEKPFPE